MKKLVCTLIVVVMVMSMFSGCEQIGKLIGKETQETTEATVDEKETEATKGTEGEKEPEETKETEGEKEPEETEKPTEPETKPSEEETKPTEEETKPTEPATTPVDVNDKDVSKARTDTTAENPAKLGEWIKSARYSATSRKYETIYWRIVGTTFDCQKDIDRYNAEDNFTVIEPLEDEDLSYCKVTYQVYFPEDFPQADWGITSADLSGLRAMNPAGGGITWKGVAYIGLGSTHDITPETEVHSGDVFTGEAIYVMINDPSVDYVFEYYHVPAGQEEGDSVYEYSNSR